MNEVAVLLFLSKILHHTSVPNYAVLINFPQYASTLRFFLDKKKNTTEEKIHLAVYDTQFFDIV